MRSFLSRFRGPLLLFAGVVVVATVSLIKDQGRTKTVPPPKEEPRPKNMPTPTYPGLQQPPTVSAAAAGLDDAEEVIGVVSRGKPRAYVLRSMRGQPQYHVVNDLVGGAPISVTYCDVGRCVRVYTDGGSEPLDVSIGGFRDGVMMLKIGTRLFSQETGKPMNPEDTERLPFAPTDFERTTWKKWREAHPETDVYIGRLPPVGGDNR